MATASCSTSGDADGAPVIAHLLSLAPFSRIVKDYFTDLRQLLRGDPHRDAGPHRSARHGPRARCTTKARSILMERLRRKVEIDFDTARRLFTLVTVLHWKG